MEHEGSLPYSQKLALIDPVLKKLIPVQTIKRCLHKIHFNIIFSTLLDLPSGLFISGFPNKIVCAFLMSPCMLKFPTHYSSLYFKTWDFYGNEDWSPGLLLDINVSEYHAAFIFRV